MPSWLCGPRLFAAWAVAAQDDADLPDGTHLRLAPSTALGLPLAPFLIWDVEPVEVELSHRWHAPDGRQLATLDLDAAGGALVGWPGTALPQDSRLAGVEARFHDRAGELALLDRRDADRVAASRSTRRWLVASPEVTFLRLRGTGSVTVRGWGISAGRGIEAMLGASPVAALSAPVDPGLPWYADGEGPELALQRVADGAPRRLGPPDRPDGPLDPLTPAAEVARVESLRGTLDAEVQALLGDRRTLPARTTISQVIPAEVLADGGHRPWQRLTNPVLSTLLLKAMDPGTARYLGLMTTLVTPPAGPDPFVAPPTRALLAAGVFACPSETVLPPPDAQEQALLARLLELQPGLAAVADVASRVTGGVVLRAFATSALVTPPPDPPAAPTLGLGDGGWMRERVGPSTRFRRQVRIAAAPLAPLVAVGRLEPGGWVSTHELVDVGGGDGPAQRAAVRLLGTVTTEKHGSYGALAESGLAAAAAPWRYRVALGDLFGRFGPPAEILLDIPPRPAIPAPVVRTRLTYGDVPVGDGPGSPGVLRCTVVVPTPERLTVGSRALSRVLVEVEGATQVAAAPAGAADRDGEVVLDVALPALLPRETRVVIVAAHFEDDTGAAGPSASTPVAVTDGRPPPVTPTGIGIVWSSRPSPAVDVEFRLAWQGAPGARYRVYLTDARGLGLPVVDGDRPLTRAEIAVAGAHLGLGGVSGRERFRLLTEPALEAGGDGTVRLDGRLPRSLETVQFLRFVPIGPSNAEATFTSCPLLPIAVPSDRRPPAPRVSVSVDADTGVASVALTATGLDLVSLRSAEPGLFEDPADPDARPPEYRLRRASGAVPDPIYAREVSRGVLHRDGESFVAAVPDADPDGLRPYVRHYYWAEVRHPAERRLPRGVLEVDLPTGAVVPSLPAQREDAPAVFSRPSPPALAVRVPATVPDLTAATVTASALPGALPGTFAVSVQVSDGPLVSASVQPGFTVQLYWSVDAGDWTLVPGPGVLAAGSMTTSFDHPGAAPATRLALVLVDPVGREAAPLLVEVAAG